MFFTLPFVRKLYSVVISVAEAKLSIVIHSVAMKKLPMRKAKCTQTFPTHIRIGCADCKDRVGLLRLIRLGCMKHVTSCETERPDPETRAPKRGEAIGQAAGNSVGCMII